MRFALLATFVLVGCGDNLAFDPGDDGAGDDAPPGERWCEINVVPLVTTRDDGVADVQVVPVVIDGEDGWLALDTGAPLTFVYRDDYIEHAAWLELGCEAHPIAGYGDDAIGVEYYEGKPIFGILGLDFVGTVGEIDYPGGRLARHEAAPADVAALPSAPLTLTGDRALVDFTIDDAALRMIFDTGAHDTLWVGVEGQPGDIPGKVQMADGSTWEVWYGSGSLELAGQTAREIPVIRGLDNDYISPELEELGAQGLIGLSAFGWRRIVWDADAERMYLGPLQ